MSRRTVCSWRGSPSGRSNHGDEKNLTDQPGRPIESFPNFYGSSQPYRAFTLIHEGIQYFTGGMIILYLVDLAAMALSRPAAATERAGSRTGCGGLSEMTFQNIFVVLLSVLLSVSASLWLTSSRNQVAKVVQTRMIELVDDQHRIRGTIGLLKTAGQEEPQILLRDGRGNIAVLLSINE
jgi:hypothetical protein